MTPEPPPLDRLLHLVDRAERGTLLPGEAAQLRGGIQALTSPPAPDLRERVVQAIRDTPARYPDDIADAALRAIEAAISRAERLAAVWADAPDPLARAMAADLTSTLRGPDTDESPTETAAIDRRYWTTRYDKETR